MSDPSQPLPLFTQPPTGIHYDAAGRPWFCNAEGHWGLLLGSSVQPAQPDASNSAGSTQSAVQPTYNFPPVFNGASPHVSSAAYPAPPQVIDPRLLPLPEDDDPDLSDPLTIAKLRGLKAATKVAGARRKGKGKKRQLSSDSEDSDAGEPVPKRGRPKGSPNFSKDDITNLLDLVEKILPLGQKGWKTVKRRYQKWARGAKRPERDGKSLETKYKQLLKTKKPTGDAQCPPDIKRAIGSKSIPQLPHRAPTPPLRRNTRMNAPELVNKLANTFDPDVQKSRDQERSERSFQTTQIITMSQQLRDAQATNESLRNQMATIQTRAHDTSVPLIMYTGDFAPKQRRKSSPKRSRYADHPDIVRVNGKVRYPSSDESGKENRDPSPFFSSFRPRSPSPLDLHRSSSSGPSQSSFSGPSQSSSSSAPSQSRQRIESTFFGQQPSHRATPSGSDDPVLGSSTSGTSRG
ncbi:hypothetical protein DFH09DRAFT_1293709 [Mycena vulgaris]|nr:hypothetical protein DFH09DRAFT_1293709 [Mycena vulgaris]